MSKQLTVTLRDLVVSEQALGELAQDNVSARMSFTLSLVLKEVGKHLDAKRAAHQKVLEKYGTPSEKQPGTFHIPVEKRTDFEKELKDLLDTEVTLAGIGRIKVSAIEAEGAKLSGQGMFALGWLLKEDVQPMFEDE